jgi:hypothetical protein
MPGFALPLAALILGSALKNKSSLDSQAAQKGFIQSDLDLRNRMANEALAAQAQARNQYQRPVMEAAEQAESDRLATAFNRNVSPAGQSVAPRVGVPRVVTEAEATAQQAAASKVRDQGQKMAAMMALGNALNALQPELAKSAVTTGLAGSAMRGSAGVLPLELQQAKLRAYSPVGDILQNLGSYGMSSAIQNQKIS